MGPTSRELLLEAQQKAVTENMERAARQADVAEEQGRAIHNLTEARMREELRKSKAEADEAEMRAAMVRLQLQEAERSHGRAHQEEDEVTVGVEGIAWKA
jgi:hypothetical protein